MARLLLVLFALLAGAACTTSPKRLEAAPAVIEPNDPFERYNRRALKANAVVDDLYIEPFADLYRLILPSPVRRSAANFTENLITPTFVLNELLQLDFEDAGHSTARFAINSTLGVAGLFDPATGMGFENRPEDFGQTLGNWGVPEGPYVVAPFVGPTTARGIFGSLARLGLSPATQIYLPDDLTFRAGIVGQRTAERRIESHETLERVFTEEDGYILLRSLFLQEQAAALYEDGDPYENLPDF
jgi:phospholipid-binding lipoprotein MlaA